MFNNAAQRPPFGMQQNTFGFGNTSGAATPFGQAQNFMSTPANTGGFNQNVGGFGTTTPMFGAMSNPQASAPLFGNTSAPSFGATQSGFGSSLFGATPQASTSGIFGGGTTSTFGQPNKASGFGFGQPSQPGGLFGQPQPTQNQSLFQPSTSTNVFGGPTAFGSNTQAGTVFKFVPVTGTDSMQKSGIAQTISTKHHCITCMKEYEAKSLEELRWEDYQANRRGPQQPAFGTQPFGSVVSTTPSIFGQTENKPAFGQATGFGQTPAFGMTNQPNTNQNIFGRTSFGAPTTTASGFGFGTNTGTTNLFGSNQQNKFGQTAPVFGQQQTANTGFGNTGNIFGQNTAQKQGIFATPTQPTNFGQQQSAFSFGQPAATQSQSIFGQQKPSTGVGFFGNTNTTTPAFTGIQFGFGNFGNTSFNKAPQPAFGQPVQQQPTFGTNLGLPSGGLFGNQPKQGTIFPSTNPTGNLFNSAFQQPTTFSLPIQQVQVQPVVPQISDDAAALTSILQMTNPFGIQKCLEGLTPKKPGELNYATNPQEIQKILDSSKYVSPNVVPSSGKIKVLPAIKKKYLFEDFEEDTVSQQYRFRNSPKRLVLNINSGDYEKPRKHLSLGDEDDEDDEDAIKISLLPVELNTSKTKSSSVITVTDDPPRTKPFALFKPKPHERVAYKDKEEQKITYSEVEIDDDPSIDVLESTSKNTTNSDNIESSGDSIAKNKNVAGIIFTRTDYFMIPKYEELQEFVDSEGRCIVDTLVIGRYGYGNVYFATPVDLTNLNIDEILHFRYRELTIYPDDTNKPPVGQGLNLSAQVTLDKVWPKSRKSHDPITDVEYLVSLNFDDILRDLCGKHGTKFIDYRPQTGSWVFRVDHFSKFGYTDSDEEETAKKLETSKNNADKKAAELKKAPEQQNVDVLPDTTKIVGLGGIQSMDVMYQTSGNTSLNISRGIDFELPLQHGSKEFSVRSSHTMRGIFEDDSMSEMSSTDVRLIEEQLEMSSKDAFPKLDMHPKEKRNKVITHRLVNLSGRVPIRLSLLNHRNYHDMAVFKGRSFKVGWSKGFSFTNVSTILEPEAIEHELCTETETLTYNEVGRVKITYRYLHFLKVGSMGDNASLEQHLKIIFDCSNLESDTIPFYTSANGHEMLTQHQDIASEAASIFRDYAENIYNNDVWNLCAAFWGKQEDQMLSRRELFSEWLEGISSVDLEITLRQYNQKSVENALKRIYVYLTCHQIEAAAHAARKSDFHQLSLLITQINSNGVSKEILMDQISQWNTSDKIDEMDVDVVKLYLILAGFPINRNVNVCEALHWRKAIALHLWYLTAPTESLNNAISMYEESFKSDIAYAMFPNPPYNSENDLQYMDIQFHIMKLFANRENALEEILNPFTYTDDSTDYRLSWLLLQTFSAFGIGRISENAKNHMHTSFAFQLENMGLYKWAVFVLMFIKDIHVKEHLISSVLDRNLPMGNDETGTEYELVKCFQLPAGILHNIKASKSKSIKDSWSGYKHLLYTKNWNDCHKIIIKKLIPSLLINEYYEHIETILHSLEDGVEFIGDWKMNGGIYSEFIKIHKSLIVNIDLQTKDDIHRLYSLVVNLCSQMTSFRPKTAMEIVCASEITKHTVAYMKTMQEVLNFDFQKIFSSYEARIDDLIMPPDYRVEDLLDTINKFYFKRKDVGDY